MSSANPFDPNRGNRKINQLLGENVSTTSASAKKPVSEEQKTPAVAAPPTSVFSRIFRKKPKEPDIFNWASVRRRLAPGRLP